MNRLAILAALSGAMAVVAGAFGTHGLSGHAADLFRTGAQYQMVHAVAALVALRMGARTSALLWLVGALLFSGSIYLLAIGAPGAIFGPVTPLGGAAMIAGWLCLAWKARG